MKSKEDLFHLIKAMSKSEKRYFTLDAKKSSKKGSKYLNLFQAINEMEEYDEAALRKRFKKNLPSDKLYLYEAILRSMRDYRSSKSLAARIKELMLDADYLYERALYDQCEERLREARNLAEQLDDRLALLEINREDRNLVWNLKKNYESRIRSLIKEKDQHLKALTEEFRYLDVLYRLGAEVRKSHKLPDSERKKTLQEKFPSTLFDEQYEPGSLQARRRFLQSAALYFQFFGNREKAAQYYYKVINWWDDNLKFKSEEFFRYIVDMSNLLNVYASLEKYEHIPDLLEKLEQEPVANIHVQGVVFQKVAIYRLMYYINTGQSKGMEALAQSIEHGLGAYQINIGSKMVLIFNMAVLYFMNEVFDSCSIWCRKIIKGMKTNSRQDIQRGAYVLNLIATYEEDDPEEVDNVLRATYRYFQTKTTLEKDAFEFKVVDFVKKMTHATPSHLGRVQLKLSAYIEDLKANRSSTAPLGLDELVLLWVNSKIKRLPISATLKRSKASASKG